MNKRTLIRIPALVAGVFLIDYLFWENDPGANALAFSPALLMLLWLSGRLDLKNKRILAATAGYVIASLSVALYGPGLSVIAYMGTTIILTGFCFDSRLRSIWSAVLQSFFGFTGAPVAISGSILAFIPNEGMGRKIIRALKIIGLPVLLLIVFGTIYRFASTVFNDFFTGLDEMMTSFGQWLFERISAGHLVFLLFAFIFISGLLMNGSRYFKRNLESGYHDLLVRKRRTGNSLFRSNRNPIALKHEAGMWLFFLVAVNLLILGANISEVIEISGTLGEKPAHAMSSAVRDGTALLILSILLTSLVLVVMFRKNLNFSPGSARLRSWAYAWILQNGWMALNVIVLNGFYIFGYGLTYKRIGLMYFLVLVVAGLVLTYIKIRQTKTLFYLFRTNAWAIFTATVLFAFLNWDIIIARFNLTLANRENLDTSFLTKLPQQALPVLMEHSTQFSKEEIIVLENRIAGYLERKKDASWQSQNLFDYLSCRKLEDYPLTFNTEKNEAQ